MLRAVMAAAEGAGVAMRPVAQSIHRKLTDQLAPAMLKVEDESHKHAGHSGNPSGDPDAETHFKVTVVSDAFEGKNMVQRHRMIYAAVDEEIKGGVHALGLHTKTPKEAGM